MARHEGQKNSRGLIIAIIVLVLLFVLLLGGVLYYFLIYSPNKPNPVVGGQREAAALKGSIKVMTDEEIQAELNRIVEEGMFRISIASTIVGYENGKAEIRIENPLNNRYLMKVNLTLDETGEEIYATDLIDPGYYIQATEFDKPLAPGEYAATAIFTALYPDTGEIVGTVGAQVKIIILPAGATPIPSPTPEPTNSPTPVPSQEAAQ